MSNNFFFVKLRKTAKKLGAMAQLCKQKIENLHLKYFLVYATFFLFFAWSLITFSLATVHCVERNAEFKEIKQNIAFVTGWVGDENTAKSKMARIPPVPLEKHSFFVSNNRRVLKRAFLQGWKTTYYNVTVNKLLESNVEKAIFWTNAGKRMKVFPQSFLDKDYEFVAWMDNKWTYNTIGVEDAIASWNKNTAVQFKKHARICCGADLEYDASMSQPRYYAQRKQYQTYMIDQIHKGLELNGPRHLCATFILYNTKHNKTSAFQNTWFDHIQQCGIQDQISLYFVAQQFPFPTVAEFLPEMKETLISLMFRKLKSWKIC